MYDERMAQAARQLGYKVISPECRRPVRASLALIG
jgi:hypothetical protein